MFLKFGNNYHKLKLSNKKVNLLRCLGKVLKSMVNDAQFCPKVLKTALKKFKKALRKVFDFPARKQHSAEEFLTKMYGLIDESKMFRNSISDKARFQCARDNLCTDETCQMITIACNDGPVITHDEDKIILSNFNEEKKKASVDQLLSKKFLEPEELDGDYVCYQCQNKGTSSFKNLLWTTPDVLTMTIERKDYKGLKSGEVSYTEELDLSEYIHETNRNSDSSYAYDLNSVIVHIKFGKDSGHYMSFCRDQKSKKFYRYNDDKKVREASLAEVLSHV